MPQVSGKSVADKLRQVTNAQAAVANAARATAQELAAERAAQAAARSPAAEPEPSTEVPAPGGTNGPSQP